MKRPKIKPLQGDQLAIDEFLPEAPHDAGLNLVTLSRSERREQREIQSKPKHSRSPLYSTRNANLQLLLIHGSPKAAKNPKL